MWTEDDLLAAVARGEEFALELLFERHYASLYRYANVILKNPEDAGEVVNETFFKVFRHAGSFMAQGSFSGWLFRIARNLCLDCIRKRKAGPETNMIDQAPDSSTSEANPLQEQVVCVLDEIKPEYREVILLKDIAGYTMQEIAVIMERSVPAVKTLHHRALKRLRELVGKEGDCHAV